MRVIKQPFTSHIINCPPILCVCVFGGGGEGDTHPTRLINRDGKSVGIQTTAAAEQPPPSPFSDPCLHRPVNGQTDLEQRHVESESGVGVLRGVGVGIDKARHENLTALQLHHRRWVLHVVLRADREKHFIAGTLNRCPWRRWCVLLAAIVVAVVVAAIHPADIALAWHRPVNHRRVHVTTYQWCGNEGNRSREFNQKTAATLDCHHKTG